MRFLFGLVFLMLFFPLTAFADSTLSTNLSTDKTVLQVDKQIMITADVTNQQDAFQPFAYLTQIKNQDQVVISLSWLTGSLSPGQSLSPAQSWIPAESGTYVIEVFVWASVDNPDALSPPLSMTVDVVVKNSN